MLAIAVLKKNIVLTLRQHPFTGAWLGFPGGPLARNEPCRALKRSLPRAEAGYPWPEAKRRAVDLAVYASLLLAAGGSLLPAPMELAQPARQFTVAQRLRGVRARVLLRAQAACSAGGGAVELALAGGRLS